MTDINPSSGSVGTQVTLTGTGFDSSNKVLFDGLVAASEVVSSDGTHLTFTVPSSLSVDNTCSSSDACAGSGLEQLTEPGVYQVAVENGVNNDNGISNSLSFTVQTSSVGTAGSSSDSIQVTSPTANAQWQIGQTYQIQWMQPMPSDPSQVAVGIVLTPPGTTAGISTVVASPITTFLQTQSNGYGQFSYSWTVPSTLTPGQYYFQFAESGSPTVNSQVFSLVAASTGNPPPASNQTLTISLDPTVAIQSGSVIPGGTGYMLLAVDLTAGSSSDATVSSLNFGCGGYACNQITNLRMVSLGGSGQTWTGSPQNSFLFLTPNLVIPRGTTQVFEVVGDVTAHAPVGQQISLALTNNLVTLAGQTQGSNVTGMAWGNILNVVGSM